jgi:dihydroxy-acid dehydratase
MTDEDVHELESCACPGAGACGGQFTANTMATVIDALGISPRGLSGIPARHPDKEQAAYETGKIAMDVVREDIRPSQILTRTAFEKRDRGRRRHGRLDERRPPPARDRA